MAERIKWASLPEELQEGFNDCSFEDEDDFILVEDKPVTPFDAVPFVDAVPL